MMCFGRFVLFLFRYDDGGRVARGGELMMIDEDEQRVRSRNKSRDVCITQQ